MQLEVAKLRHKCKKITKFKLLQKQTSVVALHFDDHRFDDEVRRVYEFGLMAEMATRRSKFKPHCQQVTTEVLCWGTFTLKGSLDATQQLPDAQRGELKTTNNLQYFPSSSRA